MAAWVLDSMDSEEILAAVESVYREQVEGNAFCFRAAYEFASIHNGDAVGAAGRVLPGMERAVRIGGAGTPLVREFAAAQFGARMQMGTLAARYYLADALDVWHRLPRIAARLDAGEVKVSFARLVAKETRHLSVEAAGRVDADMAEVADGRLPWSRFCARLEGRIVAADPELAAAREAEARERVFARASRSSAEGMRGFHIRGPVAVITRIDATVAYLAEALKALGDTDEEDLRRLKAAAVLSNPTQAVELLAAFAAHSGQLDLPLPAEDPAEEAPDGPADEASADAEEPPAPDDGPGRSGSVAVFVKPLPFRPTDLPGWLARLAHACAGGSSGDCSAGGPAADQGSGGGGGGSGGDGGGTADPAAGWVFSWQRLLPQVTVFAHVAEETLAAGEGVVRWEGQGPTTWDYLREAVFPYQPVRFTPVIDLAGQEPVDSYEIPGRHRQAVHLRTPADCFPFSTNTSRNVDIDHNEEYEHAPDDPDPCTKHNVDAGQGPDGDRQHQDDGRQDGGPDQRRHRTQRARKRGKKRGQSRMGNYGPLARFHHRVKTHGHWTVKQPFDGIYVWRDPSGQFYLVDHTGTRKITDGTLPTRRPLRDHGGVHYYETDFTIEVDFA